MPEKNAVTRVTDDFLAPMFPVGSLFGMNPLTLMREFTGPANTANWVPAVDIRKCNGNLVVTAELPGLKKEEVQVKLTNSALIIEGERKREHTDEHDGFHRFERSYGSFYRAIPLPEGAKTEMTKAELTDGILKITMPVPTAKKLEEPNKVRAVPIEAGTAKAAKV